MIPMEHGPKHWYASQLLAISQGLAPEKADVSVRSLAAQSRAGTRFGSQRSPCPRVSSRIDDVARR